jgi:hypothetical protein
MFSNATVNLTMMAREEGSTPSMAYKSDIDETLNSYGFMNLSLLIINPYGVPLSQGSRVITQGRVRT